MLAIILPVLGTNEHLASIRLMRTSGSTVRRGECVGSAETTKAALDLEAPADGVFYPVVQDGCELAFGQVFAVVSPGPVSAAELATFLETLRPAPPPIESAAPPHRPATKKAELLAHAHGIDLALVQASGATVTAGDVERHLASSRENETRTEREPPASTNVSLDAGVDADHVCLDGRPELVTGPGAPPRLLLLGGGNGAITILDTVMRARSHRPVAILDDRKDRLGKTILGVPVVGPLSRAMDLLSEGLADEVILAISSARALRRRIFGELRAAGASFANIIDPSCTLHTHATMGTGNVLMANTRLGACTRIGDNNFLSAYVNLEHHNRLGSHCTFGPQVTTSGDVIIGDDCHFGAGIAIEPGVRIGDGAQVGSGCVLVSNVPPRGIAKTRAASVQIPVAAAPTLRRAG